MPSEPIVCPKLMRGCARPGSCPGCRMHAALQSHEGDQFRQKLMLLWEGKPLKATCYEELMGSLGLSEAEARDLECQEQSIMDREVARFPKSVH